MIFVDTDIFVIDKLFPRDHRYKVNKRFLEEAQQKATSVYNLLELCGLGSFALTVTELTTLFTSFHTQYDLRVLYPRILRASPDEMIRYQVSKVFEKICLKMNYPDAQILLIAEEYGCSEFVTWNTKHFDGRTHLPVKTPQDMVADSDKQ